MPMVGFLGEKFPDRATRYAQKHNHLFILWGKMWRSILPVLPSSEALVLTQPEAEAGWMPRQLRGYLHDRSQTSATMKAWRSGCKSVAVTLATETPLSRDDAPAQRLMRPAFHRSIGSFYHFR